MLINEEVPDRLEEQDSDEKNFVERFCIRLGITRYNQIISVLEIAIPLLLGIGVAVGVFIWIRTDSFINFIEVWKNNMECCL